MSLRGVGLPRPCKKCEQRFQPTSKDNRLCEDCQAERRQNARKKLIITLRMRQEGKS